MMTPSIICVALAVYYEARNQPVAGQYAVAEVVVNRVKDARFPDSACAVISEDRGPKAWDCQFSFMCDGLEENPHEVAAWARAQGIAAEVWSTNPGTVEGATHFAHVDVNNRWTRAFTHVTTIGAHKFYREGE